MILLLLFHLILLVKTSFTAWPEMLSFPYLINHGFVPYKDFVLIYPPLLPLALKNIFSITGFSLGSLKITTWTIILLTDILVYLLSKKSKLILLFYILIQLPLDGNQLWFDSALTLPLLLSFMGLQNYLASSKNLWAWISVTALIICLGIKQSAIIYLVTSLILVFWTSREQFTYYLISLLTALLAFIVFLGLYLFNHSALLDFVNYTFIFPLKYWIHFPGYASALPRGTELTTSLVLLSFVLLSLFSGKIQKTKFQALFAITAFIATFPRFSFFHLQPALPFVVLCLSPISSAKLKTFLLVIVLLLCLPKINRQMGQIDRFTNTQDTVSTLLAQKSNHYDEVFLLGPHSAYYVFSQTLPPRPWIDNFPWYWQTPGVTEKSILGMIANPPNLVIISTPTTGNWFDLGVYQPRAILEYVRSHYNLIASPQGFEVWAKTI